MIDMEGCPGGCFDGPKGRHMQMEQIIKAAKEYAKREQKNMVIVEENGALTYYTAEYAASAGFVAIDYVSPYQ